ncbi:Glutamate receptor ionotropic, kainate 1-like 2 [Homarus americanus]|uniref:Glutamate receptor ionotropic, kainate 1-like 2 n=1 Tax=Homarus americanus TaxID=6706 RepID=A0A8J5JW94_HOMAM|nr:Glutamate receptor ionotropic, kainate 1-like 2 [Homarus americanus]
MSVQVLVGWWLVFCLIITTGYRSSLIAHLTVQGKSATLEGFMDLVQRDNWKWGSEAWFMTGVPLEYFSKHTDPVVQKIYKEMETDNKEVVLGLNHLQGAFYLLFLGSSVALLSLLGENFVLFRYSNQ